MKGEFPRCIPAAFNSAFTQIVGDAPPRQRAPRHDSPLSAGKGATLDLGGLWNFSDFDRGRRSGDAGIPAHFDELQT
jgi:hypothetical protein